MYLKAHISNQPELQMNAACQVWFYEAWREGNHINNHRQLQSPEAPQTKAPAWVQSLEESRKYICKYRGKQKAEIHTS